MADEPQEGAARDASEDVEIAVPADGTEVEISHEEGSKPQPEEGAAPGQEPSESGGAAGSSGEDAES